MISDFSKIKIFGSYISKDYSEELLRLLHLYMDISASEAASRLDMHIKTVQDFFDAMFDVGLLDKKEVYESKRPYYRYTLKSNWINLEYDISKLLPDEKQINNGDIFIREKKNANVRYTTARSKLFFSTVTIWTGRGREAEEKKVSLTTAQGKFLFNLPFPNAEFASVPSIMKKAEVPEEHKSEILDIVNLLIEYKIIEIKE
ncbi:MAG: hypothetical protein C0412_11875 [Flavobacterium sp.]|nr:hypothetical protein [Flavobacterium sp.]